MIFSSYSFLLSFLPVVWLGFMVLRWLFQERPALRSMLLFWLLGSSLWFYSQWYLPDLAVLVAVVVVNYLAALIGRGKAKYFALSVIVLANLSVLAVFKYWPWLGAGQDRMALLAGLPLGISFYIFQAIAFQVDLSRGLTKLPKWADFAVFLSFFPQLIAGPIVQGRQLLPQLARLHVARCCIGLGFTLLIMGLSKKVLVADSFAGGVDAIYAGEHAINLVTTLAGAFGYGVQLYFDFSGYADMAVGLGLLFGLRLPQNFRRPYTAPSLAAFWRRWHITLSAFLREYLYISLGGNRLGLLRRNLNLLVTMILGGLWHGAGLQFLLWGVLHGGLLAVEQTFRQWLPSAGRTIPRCIKMALTVSVVMLLWIPFRAANLDDAAWLLSGLANWTSPEWPDISMLMQPVWEVSSDTSSPATVLFWSVITLAMAATRPTTWRWALVSGPIKRGVVSGFLLLVVLKTLADRPEQPFLYFQF